MGYGPWGHKESNTTRVCTHEHTQILKHFVPNVLLISWYIKYCDND